MIQFLPGVGEGRRIDLDPGDVPEGASFEPAPDDDAWTEAKAVVATVEDHELVDPTLSSERLLYRLFHQPGVKVFEPRTVRDACRCSDEGVKTMLRGFAAEDRREMVGDDGMIGVTCEFCSAFRAFDPKDFED
jgi:molecular chaperone Hsp33